MATEALRQRENGMFRECGIHTVRGRDERVTTFTINSNSGAAKCRLRKRRRWKENLMRVATPEMREWGSKVTRGYGF
jgi:hypothetical protein